MNHYLLSLIFCFVLSINTLHAQSDTTLTMDVKTSEKVIHKNLIGPDIYQLTYPIIYGGAGIGLKYERLHKLNRYFVINAYYGKHKGGLSDIEESTNWYGRLGYRFYIRKKEVSRKNVNGETYYLTKRQKHFPVPHGFYLGIVISAAMDLDKYDDYREINILGVPDDAIKSQRIIAGAGGSIGYQFLLGNSITIDATLPVAIGYSYGYSTDEQGNNYKGINRWDIIPMLNLNINYAF